MYVGMNRLPYAIHPMLWCVPHVRGDEPQDSRCTVWTDRVFPMYVGMNRESTWLIWLRFGVPHVRGDEPHWRNIYTTLR